MTRRRVVLLLLIAAACSEVRLDPSPSCSYRNERAAIPDGGTSDERAGVVVAGQRHACAMRRFEDEVYCWGSNDLGQLSDVLAPIPGEALAYDRWSRDVLLSAGGAHTCVATEARTGCWGNNDAGQLGDGTTEDRSGVVEVELPPEFGERTSLAAGLLHTCASDGSMVVCWGDNRFGQLGRETEGDCCFGPAPVEGVPARNGLLVAGSGHTCAVVREDPDLSVYCWGDNSVGQLGDGTTDSSPRPVRVIGIRTAFSLSAGPRHTCVQVNPTFTEPSGVLCWGDNAHGEIGDPSVSFSSVPVRIGRGELASPALGGFTSLTRSTDGTLFVGESAGVTCVRENRIGLTCWGANDGLLIPTGTQPIASPIMLETPTKLAFVAIGAVFACATTCGDETCFSDGDGDGELDPIPGRETVVCWGSNEFGELGRAGESSAIMMEATALFAD